MKINYKDIEKLTFDRFLWRTLIMRGWYVNHVVISVTDDDDDDDDDDDYKAYLEVSSLVDMVLCRVLEA